jgi:hypothetical protein
MLCSLKLHLLVGVLLTSFSGAVSVSAQVVLPVQNPDNGHFYEAVTVPGGISWIAAYALTQTRTYAGIRGHLATITSAEENQFLVNHFPRRSPGATGWAASSPTAFSSRRSAGSG